MYVVLWRSRASGEWQPDSEGSALPVAVAARLNSTAVREDKVLRDGKAKTYPLLSPRRGNAVVLPESLEHQRQRFWTYPSAAIADLNVDV